MKRIILALGICVLFTSCHQDITTFDGSSKENFDKSKTALYGKLNVLQQDRLNDAIKLLLTFYAKGNDEKEKYEFLYKKLNNKTVDQVFDMAEKLANKKNIKWHRDSLEGLDWSLFEEKIIQTNVGDFSQIDSANSIQIKFSTHNFGYVFSPILVDKNMDPINFEELPLTVNFKVLNINEESIYFTNKKIINHRDQQSGIKIFYNEFKDKTIINGRFNVVAEIKTPKKIIIGKLNDILIDENRIMQDAIQNEISKQMAITSVKNFIESIGGKNYRGATNLIQVELWNEKQVELFSWDDTYFIDAEQTASDKDLKTLLVIYQTKDKSGLVKTLKQNFTLKYIQNNWIIVSMTTIESREDLWKKTGNNDRLSEINR